MSAYRLAWKTSPDETGGSFTDLQADDVTSLYQAIWNQAQGAQPGTVLDSVTELVPLG